MVDQLVLASPESSDTQMEGHFQPKVATLNFGHPQDLAALGHMDMSVPFLTSRHPSNSYEPRDRLALWYHRNDGPWTPPGLTSPQGDIRHATRSRGSLLVFPSQYRESIAPSECDTVLPGVVTPSDSGYGGSSRPKHSVGNGSVCDESLDRNHETLGELGFPSYSQDMMLKAGVNQETPWPQSQQLPPSARPASGRQINPDRSRICEICEKSFKTKSEFKKHKQRHDKPFKCEVKGCIRREGFSTPNDLERHKRSLHPDQQAAGNRYRCPVGPCMNKEKIWPRADNFRAHMKRVHQIESMTDEDLDKYKFTPSTQSQEVSQVSHSNAATTFDKFNVFPLGDSADTSDDCKLPRAPVIDLSSETSPVEHPGQIQTGETTVANKFNDEGSLHTSNGPPSKEPAPESDDILVDDQTEMSRSSLAQLTPPPGDIEPTTSRQRDEKDSSLHSKVLDSKFATNVASFDSYKADRLNESRDSPHESPLRSPQRIARLEGVDNVSERTNASPELKSAVTGDVDIHNRDSLLKFLEELQRTGVLGELGFKKEDPVQPEAAKQELAGDPSKPAHACSQCQKTFFRPCELKKHQKRHLKPYGCTFPDCYKRFGSKNDWKRHENSQHYMLEHWRCDEKQTDASPEACNKVIHRRELFKHHLDTCHHIKEQALVERKLETCRVGRNCEARFWCGFCREIIEIKKEGIEAWAERFNHIDDHFHGRNNRTKREISDWKDEYSLYPETESQTNGSEDSNPTSSTPATSTGFSNKVGPEKQHSQTVKHKRKRDDGPNPLAFKRVETLEEMPIYICCQCNDPMPVTIKQCTNYPCEHKLCEYCYS